MPLGSVANDRVRHLLAGYARVSRLASSPSLSCGRGAPPVHLVNHPPTRYRQDLRPTSRSAPASAAPEIWLEAPRSPDPPQLPDRETGLQPGQSGPNPAV